MCILNNKEFISIYNIIFIFKFMKNQRVYYYIEWDEYYLKESSKTDLFLWKILVGTYLYNSLVFF